MTRPQAKRLVLLAVVIAVVVTTVQQIRREQTPDPAIYVGGFVAAVLLTLMAEAAPQIAAGFATILLVSILLTDGTDIAAAIRSATGGTRQPPAAGNVRGGAGGSATIR